MKQKIVTVSALLALLLVASPVLAEQGSNKGPGGELRIRTQAEVKAGLGGEKARVAVGASSSASTTREERNASSTEKREEKKASSTDNRIETQTKIAERKIDNTVRVLEATVGRLEKILSRIESRIAKVKETGASTAVSEKFVAEAKTNITLAKTSIAAFASIDLSGTSFVEKMDSVKKAAAEVKLHIKNTHTSLMNAVRNLKASGGVKTGNASSTASTTASTTVSTASSTDED